MILLTKFVYFNDLNLDPTTGTGLTLTDVSKVNVDIGANMKNNSMRIELKNDPIDVFSDGTLRHRHVNPDGNPVFKAVKTTKGSVINEEIINVYALNESLDPTIDVESDDYLLFQGVINKGKIPFKNNSNAIELHCKDRTAIILDKLSIPQGYKPVDTSAPDSIGWRSPFIVQNLIRNASESDNNVPTFDNNGNLSLNGIYLVDARLFSDGIVDSGTTTSAATRKLIETGQNFTSTVNKDDWVRNTSTNEYAYVSSVDSDTQLTLTKDIMTSGAGYEISNGFIQDTRADGTAFPVTSFSQINKPISEGIEDLSSIEKTNTVAELDSTYVMKRNMVSFIDKKNRFHWYLPSDTPEWIFEAGQTDAISPDDAYHRLYSVEPETFVDDNINFIIFKAGEDMNGVQIKHFSRAPFSGTPNVKDSLKTWPNIARKMKWEDADAGNISKTQFDEYGFPAAYPVTPAWDRQDRAVNNDTEYNDNFIEEARLRGKEKCSAIFRKVSDPRWKGKLQIRGEPIIVGDLIDFTSKPHGIRNIKVRVNQVTHSITSLTGWITTVNFEEDENEAEVLA